MGQAAADDDTVVVGAAVALSGFVAPYDDPYKGAILAIDDINAKGGVLGKQIEFVTADTKSDPAQGANAAIEVLEQGAELVLVTCDFDFGSPAAIAAQSRGKIAFSLCAGDPKFGVQGIGDLAFSMGIGTPAEGAIMAEWMHSKGLRKPFILKDTQVEYTKKLADYFQARWEDGLGEVAGHDTFHGQTDTSAAGQITRIKESDADFIAFTGAASVGGAPIIKQIRAAGIDLPIVGGVAVDGVYWLDAVPNLSEFYSVNYSSIHGDDPIDGVQDFWAKYEERFGPTVVGVSVTGYSIIQAWTRAVERAGTFDAKAVALELEKFDKEPLLSGATTFTSEWHINFDMPMMITEIQNGVRSGIGRFAANKVPPVDF
jgi:branched-chain amino acid transport system substrate-binding protein